MLKRIFALALGLALGAPVLAADSISATHVFPASLIYSRSFLEFVKRANEAGKGEFAIQVRSSSRRGIGRLRWPIMPTSTARSADASSSARCPPTISPNTRSGCASAR